MKEKGQDEQGDGRIKEETKEEKLEKRRGDTVKD